MGAPAAPDGMMRIDRNQNRSVVRRPPMTTMSGRRIDDLKIGAQSKPGVNRALSNSSTVGITAGASAPEVLVDEVIETLKSRFEITIRTVTTADEAIAFNVPKELRDIPGGQSA